MLNYLCEASTKANDIEKSNTVNKKHTLFYSTEAHRQTDKIDR